MASYCNTNEYAHSHMSQDLLDWCNQIQILRNIRVGQLCDNFSDGVLFLHLVHQLLPDSSEEVMPLLGTVFAAENHFDKIENWKKINEAVLRKYDLVRSEWFLTYLAKAKDGYIQDLLEDLRKVVPEPPVNVRYYDNLDYGRITDTSVHSVDFGNRDRRLSGNGPRPIFFEELESRYLELDYDRERDRSRYQQKKTFYSDDDLREIERQDEYQHRPHSSYYLTPLENELSYSKRLGNGRYRTGFRNLNRRVSNQQEWEDQRQNNKLRQIQRNDNWSFCRRRTWQKPFMRYRQYNNRSGYYRNLNFSKNRSGYRRRFSRNTGFQGKVPIHSLDEIETPRQNEPVTTEESSQIENEGDYLNQRFNYYQNRSYAFNSQQRFSKYFYKYYLQYPVSCNNCIDNNLECRCKRFGLDNFFNDSSVIY